MEIRCTHWINIGGRDAGGCKLNLYGGRPSNGVCIERCQQYNGPRPCARCWSNEHTVEACPISPELSREQAAQNIRNNVGGCNC